MFDEDDPRTYAIPLVRGLEALKALDTVPLSDSESSAQMGRIEDIVEDTVGAVDVVANLDGDADKRPESQFLYFHHTDDEDGMWVDFSGRAKPYETDWGTRHQIEFDVLYAADGSLYVDVMYTPTPSSLTKQYIYRGALSEFTFTEALSAGLRAVETHSAAMIRDGVTPTETIDFLHTDLFGMQMENWAADRDTGYEAIRKNREGARAKLEDADWADDLTERRRPRIDSLYHALLDDHEETIDAIVDTIIPIDMDTPANRAVLKVTLLEAYAVVNFQEDEQDNHPDYELFVHKLGEMPVNAENFASHVRILTAHNAIDIEEFASRSESLFSALRDAYDIDQPVTDLGPLADSDD